MRPDTEYSGANAGLMKQAAYNAIAVKEYYEQFGATIIMCQLFDQHFALFTLDCINRSCRSPTCRRLLVR